MKPRQTKHRIFAAAVIGTLLAIAVFLPEVVGIGWHMIYGKEASYREWRIPVPNGWFAARQGESLTLERMLLFPVRGLTPTVVFLPMHTARNLRFDARIWTQAQVHLQGRRGYRLADKRNIQMGGAPGYCWEFVKRKDDSLWWITCMVPSERLSADFSGGHSFAGAFYSILPRITWDPGSIRSGAAAESARTGTGSGSVVAPGGFK